MNVRIKNQNLRFKISEGELKTLLDGHPVHTKIDLLDKTLIASINPKGSGEEMIPKLVLDEGDAYLNLLVSPLTIQKLSEMGKSRDGLKQKINGLSLSLQVNMPEACHT